MGSPVLAGRDFPPNRKFSAAIIGGLWPSTPADQYFATASGLQNFSQNSSARATEVSRSGSELLTQNSGEMIDAMHVTYMKDSRAVQIQADLYRLMAEATRECGQQIQDAKAK